MHNICLKTNFNNVDKCRESECLNHQKEVHNKKGSMDSLTY